MIAADDTAILRQEGVADTGIFDIGGQHRLAVRRRFDPAFDDLARAFLAGCEIFQDRLPAISGAPVAAVANNALEAPAAMVSSPP